MQKEIRIEEPNTNAHSLSHSIKIGNYDLTEFVIQGTTVKELRNPAGQWTLRLRPSILNGTVVNLGDININDFCEIRVGRKKDGQALPLVMLGLVDMIRVDESVSQGEGGGIPQRSITIVGRDFGKLVVEKSVFIPQDFISMFSRQRMTDVVIKLTRKQRVTAGGQEIEFVQTFGSWLENLFNQIYNDPLFGFESVNNVNIKLKINLPQSELKKDDTENPQDPFAYDLLKIYTGFTLSQTNNSLWGYIQSFCMPPFIEFFFEEQDAETGGSEITLNVRWSPYKNKWGNYPVQGPAKAEGKSSLPFFDIKNGPTIILTSRNNIISKNVSRSDRDTWTYFHTKWRDSPIGDPEGSALPSKEKPGSGGIAINFSKEGDRIGQDFSNESNYAVFTDSDSPDIVGGELTSLVNGNEKYNPQYDFAGLKRFGLKPMVVAVPFWENRLSSVFDNVWRYLSPDFTSKYAPTDTSAEAIASRKFQNDNARAIEIVKLEKDRISSLTGGDTPPPEEVLRQALDNISSSKVRLIDTINQWIYDVFTYQHNRFSGQITVIGNSNYKIGSEIRIISPEGTPTGEEYYIEGVEHVWSFFPSVSFLTRLSVTRGTGIPYAVNNKSENVSTGTGWEGLPYGDFTIAQRPNKEPDS